MITREDAKKIMEIEGSVAGVVFQTDAAFVKTKWREEGLARVKEKLKQLGFPINYEKAKAFEWFPIGLRILSLVVIKDVFNLSDEDMKLMGNTAPKLSFVIKLLMKYFVSIETSFTEGAKLWQKHYYRGIMKTDYHKDENYALVVIDDIELPPLMRKYLEGYFQRIVQYSLGPQVKSEEQKDIEKEKHYVFKLYW